VSFDSDGFTGSFGAEKAELAGGISAAQAATAAIVQEELNNERVGILECCLNLTFNNINLFNSARAALTFSELLKRAITG
jgi:hypothetical protein